MRRATLLLILVIPLLAAPAWAQTPAAPTTDAPALASLDVALWPEYDRPAMLVIFRGQFEATTPLPLVAELRIPASVGKPSAFAFVNEGGERLNQPYTSRVEGDWLVLSFELSTPGFQLEYYAPIVTVGTQRTFEFRYTADYAIANLNLEVQVPPTAEDFALEPAAASVVPESDGLTYHLAQAGSLEAGELRTWTLTYDKADDGLTNASPEPSPTASAPGSAEGGDNSGALIFVVAFVALVAVGGGAFWLGRRVPPSQPIARSPRTPERGAFAPRRPKAGVPDDTLYCAQCGARLRPDADYCHKCGQAVGGA